MAVGLLGLGGHLLFYAILNITIPELFYTLPGVSLVDLLAGVPFFSEAHLAASATGLVLSLVLIAVGVGLLMLRRWAYNLGVLYGWLSIAHQVGWMAYLLLVAQPVILDGLSNMPIKPGALSPGTQPEDYRHFLQTMEIITTLLTGLGLICPVFVLVMLAVNRKAFRREKWAPEGAVEVADAASPAQAPAAGEESAPDDRIGPARP